MIYNLLIQTINIEMRSLSKYFTSCCLGDWILIINTSGPDCRLSKIPWYVALYHDEKVLMSWHWQSCRQQLSIAEEQVSLLALSVQLLIVRIRWAAWVDTKYNTITFSAEYQRWIGVNSPVSLLSCDMLSVVWNIRLESHPLSYLYYLSPMLFSSSIFLQI